MNIAQGQQHSEDPCRDHGGDGHHNGPISLSSDDSNHDEHKIDGYDCCAENSNPQRGLELPVGLTGFMCCRVQ